MYSEIQGEATEIDYKQRYETVIQWLKKLDEVCSAAADGDLEKRILMCEGGAEVEQLAKSINRMLDISDAFVRESRAALSYSAKGKFFRKVLLNGMPGSFKDASRLINQGTCAMESNARAVADAKTAQLKLADDFEGKVMGMVHTVASAATEMQATAETLAAAADTTSEKTEIVDGAARRTSQNIDTVTKSLQQLQTSVSEIDSQVRTSTDATRDAVSEADRTSSIVKQLSESSIRIEGALKLISQVASQTNLLALNATIEAARAGEAGKGFAVVASEVKNLAQQAGTATNEISRDIDDVQEVSTQSVSAITIISQMIARINETTEVIASSVEHQRSVAHVIERSVNEAEHATGEVSSSIEGVKLAVSETNNAAKQLLSAASELSALGEGLKQSVESFLEMVRTN